MGRISSPSRGAGDLRPFEEGDLLGRGCAAGWPTSLASPVDGAALTVAAAPWPCSSARSCPPSSTWCSSKAASLGADHRHRRAAGTASRRSPTTTVARRVSSSSHRTKNTRESARQPAAASDAARAPPGADVDIVDGAVVAHPALRGRRPAPGRRRSPDASCGLWFTTVTSPGGGCRWRTSRTPADSGRSPVLAP